jgi:eukaryotic-like serine/threonine-protein kinase
MHKCKCNLEEMLLKKGQISEEEILKIIAMFCLPLDNIHQKGVVHRDFKPQNILVSSIGPYDILLLSDFGVSKQKSLTFSATVNDKMTPQYASLEQIRSQEAEPYFDMWAVGVTIHRMMTGKLPKFIGSTFEPLPTTYSRAEISNYHQSP